MLRNSAKNVLEKIRGYVRENWGAPFVIGFMLLLVVAAASLAIGLDFLANEVTVYAFCALVAGVVLQLVCFLKYGERSGNKD
jgi:heme/copper-type cytochrome/quinol oxidase subunit 4